MTDVGERLTTNVAELDPGAAAECLRLSPAERDEHGFSEDDVREAFRVVVEHGDRADKQLRGVDLPELDLDYEVLAGGNRHPVDLRGATVEAISAEHAEVRVPLRLDDATVGGLALDNARFAGAVTAADATVTGEVDAFEAAFDGDVDLSSATFEARAAFDEATFDDDVSVEGATFEAEGSFRGAEFHGDSNLLEDNTSFRNVEFREEASFRQAEFGFCHFGGVAFAGPADFQAATFTGDAEFTASSFDGVADFDEVRFDGDTSFADTAFADDAVFRGATFRGGARVIEEDATFEGATFGADADFRLARFRSATFADVAFTGEAMFQEAVVESRANFVGTTFDGVADFDETRFDGDADFTDARFRSASVFRGAEFRGGANHLRDDAIFEGATFETDADFDEAVFESANFLDTSFGGVVDFRDAAFREHLAFAASEAGDDAYVDFTGAKLKEGRIVQPEDDWVLYDLTLASLGEVSLSATVQSDRVELLDYFRFCRTEFTEFDGHEFDFGEHTDYLDRNAWRLHAFEDDADREYAAEMTPANVERTYLKAKNCASAAGDMKAAGEFRVRRQQFSRRKNLAVVRDGSADLAARAKNLSRAAENAFLGVTCGHGMRLFRILSAFVLVPLLLAIPYAFGGSAFATSAGQLSGLGDLATAAGRATLFENVHFSYISYTTIGYGNIGPQGALARVLAGSEAYLSTVLAALVVYALVKRSEL